jgi:hypothetical protein
MMFMCVLLVELLDQVATGRIAALVCLLLGTRGSQLLRLVLSDIK